MGDLEYYRAEYQKVCQHYEQLHKEYCELVDNQKKLLADRDRLRLQVRAGLLAAGMRVGGVTGDWWAAPPVPTERGSSSFCWYSDTVLHVNKLCVAPVAQGTCLLLQSQSVSGLPFALCQQKAHEILCFNTVFT